jgi:hypothetical protein
MLQLREERRIERIMQLLGRLSATERQAVLDTIGTLKAAAQYHDDSTD